jgi:hypothetical protein
MKPLSKFVRLHPYFKVHSGKLEMFTTALPGFIARTRSEQKNLFCEFTINGDGVFCREAYTDAEGLLAHLDNIGPALAQALTIADLTRWRCTVRRRSWRPAAIPEGGLESARP